jgi:hypothetical protein
MPELPLSFLAFEVAQGRRHFQALLNRITQAARSVSCPLRRSAC